MSTNVVHLVDGSRSLLTREFLDGNGKPNAFVCDRAGNELKNDDLHKAREVYLDAISGDHYMKISHAEKESLDDEELETVCQGTGQIHGWFIPAPDYTLIGRHGERSTASAKREEPKPIHLAPLTKAKPKNAAAKRRGK